MTLLFLSKTQLSSEAHAALESCATALGHAEPPAFCLLDQESDLRLSVHRLDPWHVVALDEESQRALQDAFGSEAAALAPDHPVNAHGYLLVAVPGFEECLGSQDLKRMAWNRLKAAKYPTFNF